MNVNFLFPGDFFYTILLTLSATHPEPAKAFLCCKEHFPDWGRPPYVVSIASLTGEGLSILKGALP